MNTPQESSNDLTTEELNVLFKALHRFTEARKIKAVAGHYANDPEMLIAWRLMSRINEALDSTRS